MSSGGPYAPGPETDSVHAPLQGKQHAPVAVQPMGPQATVWGAQAPHGAYVTGHQQTPGKEVALSGAYPAYAAPVHPGGAVVADPAQALMAIQGVMVKQQIELAEVLTGCETQNRYRTYVLMGENEPGSELFFAKETSGCMERQCCGSAREFTLNVVSLPHHTPFMRLYRPFRCSCFCANRPVIDVLNGADQLVGRLHNPWRCLDLSMDVTDGMGNVRFVITGDCCQPGNFCRLPCDPFNKIDFNVRRPGSDDIVACLRRMWSGCTKEAFTDADNFTAEFPVDATAEERMLLMAAVYFIDFLRFEQKQNNNNNGGNYA